MNFDFIELLKLPASIMTSISLASAMILFLPNSIIKKLYMVNFRDKYGFVIGAVFIIFTSILSIGVITKFCKFLRDKYSNIKFRRDSKKLLASLDNYKKAIVYKLYKKDNNTNKLPLYDGAIIFLQEYKVIQKATNSCYVNSNNPHFPFFLQPWVINELKKDDELLLEFEKAGKEQRDEDLINNL